jgi:small GTP-binding protein
VKKELQILLEAIPPESRPAAEKMWAQLPPDVRRELELSLGGMLKLLRHDPGSFRDLLKLVSRSAGPVLSSDARVAIVGPVNVGKSTLYNSLVTDERNLAKASPVPGTTKVAQTADIGLFRLVDTPGADHGATGGLDEREVAFDAARQAQLLVIVFDASTSVKKSDRTLYAELKALGKPFLIALNKMDLVKPADRKQVVEEAARALGVAPDEIITVSAQSSQGVEKLLLEMTAMEPNLLSRVGQSLPTLRRQLGWQAIRRAAISSGLVALTPIPLTDVIPLSLIQGSLVLTISRIYGEKLSFRRGLELVSSFGAGWLARMLFQELSKMGGVPGWILSGSVAMSATTAIGYTAMVWFETGSKPDKAEVARVAREAQSRMGNVLKSLGRKKVTREHLTEELENKLDESVVKPTP